MKRIILAIGVLLLGASSAVHAAEHCMKTNEGAAWKAKYPDLYTKMMSYFTCENETDPAACNVFVARVAEGAYGVTDFKLADGSYMSANRIMDFVHGSARWSKLGMADDQMALNNAASGAEDHFIIAVMSDQPHGHVAVVLPGAPMKSDKWGGRLVPNSASAFLGNVDQAYVFCRLAWASKDPTKVELWWRPKGG